MTRSMTIAAALLSGLIWSSTASAQTAGFTRSPIRPYQRPTTSPYLNLINGGTTGDPAFEYYRRIRPEMEFRSTGIANAARYSSLQSQLTATQAQVMQFSGTGHSTSFLNTRGYFSGGGAGPTSIFTGRQSQLNQPIPQNTVGYNPTQGRIRARSAGGSAPRTLD